MVGTGDVVLVVLALAGQTNSATTLDLSNPGSRPFCDGPSWLAYATTRRTTRFLILSLYMYAQTDLKEISFIV